MNRRGQVLGVAWLIWALALSACPIALLVVANKYAIPAQPPPWGPLPWAAQLAVKLMWAHVGISILAATAVPLLVRDFFFRLAACFAIGCIAFVALLVYFATSMVTSGRYL